MKKESEKLSSLEPETDRNIGAIRAKLQTVRSPKEIVEIISEISDFGEKIIADYTTSENIGHVNSLQKEIVKLYDAALQILEKSSFPEYSALKKFIESIKESFLDSVELLKTEFADNLREKGCEYRDKGSTSAAMRFFDKALEINPNSTSSWFERGNLFFDIGDFTSAIRDYEMVLEYDPINPNALCNIGLSLNNMNMFADAKKYFQNALTIAPNFKEALVGIGNSHLRLEEFAEAEKYLGEALDLYPDCIEANLVMGSLKHEFYHDFEAAKQLAERVLNLDPDNIVAKANLAETLLAFGKNEYYEESASLSSEVLKKGPPDLGYAMRLVKVCSLYFRKEMKEATEAALDLVKYYNSAYDNIFSAWKFIGLRKTIADNKEASENVKSLLNILIDLAETPNVYTKNRLLKELPILIKSIITDGRVAISPSYEREIIVKNTSEPNPWRKGYYDWKIFLTPPEALNEVEKVQYVLHETFREPVRTKTNRNTGFMLESSGWGEFQVKVKIYFKNETEPLVKYHWLKLGYHPS